MIIIIVKLLSSGKSKSDSYLIQSQLKAKITMSQPHSIKLRGGWKVHLNDSVQPWNFPAQTQKLQEKGPILRFTRRFQSPPVRSNLQQLSLCWANINGLKIITIDSLTISLQTHTPNFIEISSGLDTHLIEFTVDTSDLTPDQEFGVFWLEIKEADPNEKPITNS